MGERDKENDIKKASRKFFYWIRCEWYNARKVEKWNSTKFFRIGHGISKMLKINTTCIRKIDSVCMSAWSLVKACLCVSVAQQFQVTENRQKKKRAHTTRRCWWMWAENMIKHFCNTPKNEIDPKNVGKMSNGILSDITNYGIFLFFFFFLIRDVFASVYLYGKTIFLFNFVAFETINHHPTSISQ